MEYGEGLRRDRAGWAALRATAASQHPSARSAGMEHVCWRPGLQVLVVEPAAQLGDLIRRNLELEGALVRTADSLMSACRSVRAHGVPDVILLDIDLPRANPYDSLMVLRAVCRSHVPAGFLSRTKSPVPRFVGCPVKGIPFTSIDLVAFLDQILLPSESQRPAPSRTKRAEDGTVTGGPVAPDGSPGAQQIPQPRRRPGDGIKDRSASWGCSSLTSRLAIVATVPTPSD